jgi:hypothetical protein
VSLGSGVPGAYGAGTALARLRRRRMKKIASPIRARARMAMPAPSPPAAPGESPFEAELDGSALAGAALESGFELDCVEALLVLDDVSDDVPVFVAGVLVAATAVMGQYCSRF